MSSAYRSAYGHIVGLKLEEAREAREALVPWLPALRAIVDARVARVAGGIAGLAGAATMIGAAAFGDSTAATEALVLGALALPLSWVAARLGLRATRALHRVPPEPELTGQLDRDLARIDESDVRRQVRAILSRADRLELASVALPIAGITFLLPLFLHFLFATAVWHEDAREFTQWIRVSLVIVGHAHIALAILGYRFARKLHQQDDAALARLRVHREWAKSWGITIGVSCLPGIVLICVPPLLVAATGIVFIPFMFIAMHQAIVGERSRLASLREAVPEIAQTIGARVSAMSAMRVSAMAASAEEQQREADRDDEHAGADAGDRAQA